MLMYVTDLKVAFVALADLGDGRKILLNNFDPITSDSTVTKIDKRSLHMNWCRHFRVLRVGTMMQLRLQCTKPETYSM